ncbi:MAG: class I SAM-dependent RNA methyltransferase [Paracoccaceae bacterium]|nr:class I SAM-dependent RNA methyltransferase [Paracoccaceae bacterium]
MICSQPLLAKIGRINSHGIGEVLDKNGKPLLEIPFTLPDEIIQYDDESINVNSISFKLTSPHRTNPLCPQFKKCGGCSLQHASKSFVNDWKKSIVVQELAKKKLYPKFRNTFVTPERSRRRAVFSGRRTKKGTIVGFKAARTDQIVSVLGCIIIDKKILSFLPGMEMITASACTRSSTIKIFVSVSHNGLDVLVKDGKLLNRDLRIKLVSIAVEYNIARLSWDGELIALIKPPIQTLGMATIIPPEEFFMQATKEAEMAMVDDVCESLENENAVVDLFSGFGTFALPLAKTKNIIAFEKSTEMLTALDLASRRTPNHKAIKTCVRNLYKNPVSKEELSRIDGAVINPPRAGATAQCKELSRSDIKTIVLVSCNPITFASDAEMLSKGSYILDWVRVIDQFRWSHHIEVIGKFSKNF